MRRLFLDPVFASEADTPARACDHPGCVAGGEFRAPKSRLELHDYYWFCLEHVRAYNSAWNYYAGMSDGEIEAEIRHDTVWQRPSWRLGDRYGPGYAARIRDYFGMFSGGTQHGRRNDNRAREAAERVLSAREQALAVFEIEPPFTPVRLKARARLEPHRGEWWFDFEHGKGLFARRQHPLGSLPRAVVIPPTALRAAGEHAEIITDSCGITRAEAISQPPARTLPNRIMADLGLNLAVVHPRIVIPSGIVGANVLEAKPVIIVEVEPRFRRTEFSSGDTAGMIANPRRGVGVRREDGIEEQASHETQYGRRAESWQGDVLYPHGQSRVAARARAGRHAKEKGRLPADARG